MVCTSYAVEDPGTVCTLYTVQFRHWQGVSTHRLGQWDPLSNFLTGKARYFTFSMQSRVTMASIIVYG